jgi:Asp/Glu/hydantoin racemase
MQRAYEHYRGAVEVPRKQAVGGLAIGIIVIDVWYPMLPGNVANASTYSFPVAYSVLRGATVEQILTGDPILKDLIIEAGKELIQTQGVRAIVGACGSFANYQSEVAAALDVPVFMSVMLQAPMILRALKPQQKLGIIAASESAVTAKVFQECGITDSSRLVIVGAKKLSEFQKILQCQGGFDTSALEQGIVALATDMVAADPDVSALLLQCSDLPPYAAAIQNATGLPVFDMNGLVEWAYYATVRKPYAGFV